MKNALAVFARRAGAVVLGVLLAVGGATAQIPAPEPAQPAGQAAPGIAEEMQAPAPPALAAVGAERLRRAIRRTLVDGAVLDPLGSSLVTAARTSVTAVAEKTDVLGRARFTLPLGDDADAVFAFEAPLTNSATTFATAEGLAPKASLKATLKYAFWSTPQRLPDAAAGVGSLARSGATSLEDVLARIEYLRRLASRAHGEELLRELRNREAQDPANEPLVRLLRSDTLVASPERFYTALVQALPGLVQSSWAGHMSVGLEAQRRIVDYLKAETFEATTFDRTGKRFIGAVGVSRTASWRTGPDGHKEKSPVFFAGVSFRGGEGADVEDPRNICRPEGAAGALECFERPVGEPLITSTRELVVELRQWSTTQALGINPRYIYSRKKPSGSEDPATVKTQHTFEVPIYFIQQKKDPKDQTIRLGADLIGGVTVGWRSKGATEGAFATVFLSKVFEMPKGD